MEPENLAHMMKIIRSSKLMRMMLPGFELIYTTCDRDDCDQETDISYCSDCDYFLCPNHWDKQHKISRQRTAGRYQRTHERVDPILAQVLSEIFSASQPVDEEFSQLAAGHTSSFWFGAEKHKDEWTFFEGTTKYEDLVLKTPKALSEVYPGLVSFVGQTGDGKSSLINLLIKVADLLPLNTPSSKLKCFERQSQPVPVIGTPGECISTSANVHLYLDPQSAQTERPILFADSEGLVGGEAPPKMTLQTETTETDKVDRCHNIIPARQKWKINWAKSNQNTSRGYMVKEFYPRILYTFSDVVVFVLGNHRTHQEAVLQLADWAFNVIQSSTNQSVLPHAIIVLNKSEMPSASKNWEAQNGKDTLLDGIGPESEFFHLQALKKHVEFWRERYNKEIGEIPSAKELLESYYASIKVIHIPRHDNMKLVEKQVTLLYKEIYQSLQDTYKSRERLEMRLNAENFMLFMQKGFEHFTTDFTHPFNFIQAWFEINQMSTISGLEKGILALAIEMQKIDGLEGLDLWRHISGAVAACICLNLTRAKTPRTDKDELFRRFSPLCDKAVKDFYNLHWQCEYEEVESNEKKPFGRCVNVQNTHKAKGHQNSDGLPRDGHWKAGNTLEEVQNQFKDLVLHEFGKLLAEQSPDKAWEHHERFLIGFYENGKGKREYRSSSTCFGCLCDIPAHSLPCGHVICVKCVVDAGTELGNGFVELSHCPIRSCRGEKWHGKSSWLVSIKPPQAGVRIMTLDGGGTRGLVELEILRHLENALNCDIPIQAFFDLIVGTSAGGLIALGLAHNWRLSECTNKFKTLMKESFSKPSSEFAGWFGKIWSTFMNHGRYHVEPFEAALGQAFSSDPLFGSQAKELETEPIKVAVTSTRANSLGNRVIVFSNYNRRSTALALYDFDRPESRKNELTVRETARATSAAPTYFRELKHKPTQQVYLDGGIYHNNPIKIANAERKVIWPNHNRSHPAIRYPDVILSIGTGYARSQVEETLTDDNPVRAGSSSYFKTLFNVGMDYINNGLACERAWMEWIETREPEPQHIHRFRRLNVPLDFEPKLDDIREETVDKYIKQTNAEMGERAEDIQQIARQLIASCFFFHFKSSDWNRAARSCKGTIECRFPPKKDYIKKLGQYFHELHRDDSLKSYPQFVVKETHRSEIHTISISPQTIKNMVENGIFNMPLELKVSEELAETDIIFAFSQDLSKAPSISGFPRKVSQDYSGLVHELRRAPQILDDNLFSGRQNSFANHIQTGALSQNITLPHQ